MASNLSNFLVADGVMLWFNGPDWTKQAEEVFEDASSLILAYAQRNAPWEDRSGMAREGLGVEVSHSFGEVVLELFHTVDYGLWLEVIQNGRFATIMPTLEVYAPRVFEAAGGVILTSQEGDNYSL